MTIKLGARPTYRQDLMEILNAPCSHRIANQVGTLRPKDRKGADMSEWPEDLRVSELPEASR